MIATITVQSHRMSQTQDHRFSRTSNTAGAPLPLIPRRTSSSKPTLTPSPSLPLPARNALSASSSYPSSSSAFSPISTPRFARNDSDSSSSSSSPSDGTRPTIRTRRIRGVRNPAIRPPELSIPPPTLTTVPPTSPPASVAFPSKNDTAHSTSPNNAPSRPMLYTPGMLRVTANNPKPTCNVSESNVSPTETSAQGSRSASALCESFGETNIVRKKSGQLVKSSLKSSRSNSLSVFTFPQSSKSEPTTPTSKAVHFDSKLEHVKLFLAEQKPLAVSRDGSPTDDTSGTDSDFPKFIFGEDDDIRRPKKKLVMQVANMPSRVDPCSDVALEDLILSSDGTSILGKVRVRNLAYSKWVAVRFTFDAWQTTSEVTGKYVESLSPEFDRFAFAIRLNDLLARIEGKTLVLAVKFSIEGRDMWDNNCGQNYMATFTKTKASEESQLSQPTQQQRSPFPPMKSTLSDDEASTDMADLRSRLEKVVQSKERTGPAPTVQQPRRGSSSADPDTTSFRTSASFASRYDFSASFKSSWKPDIQAQPLHSRTQSFPLSAASRGSSIPWPQKSPSDPYAFRRQHQQSASTLPPHPQSSTPPSKTKPVTLGSPRDLSDDLYHSGTRQPREYEDASSFTLQQPRPVRNHQRGYFDISASPPSLRRTPPGTPREHGYDDLYVASPQRYNSFPPLEPSLSRNSATPTLPSSVSALSPASFGALDVVDSELSTPSMVTPSSSRESTPSPSEVFMSLPSDGDKTISLSPDTHYRQFLSKFCFFTGPGSTINHEHDRLKDEEELIPRAHSASEIEDFLSGITPTMHGLPTDPVSPPRSSSLDDIALDRSGSLTPTLSRLSIASLSLQSQTLCCGGPARA